MTDFITNGASELPPVKQDVRVPTGSIGEWTAEDSNDLRQAALDLRSAAILETQNRLAGDAAIIASGVTPANVNLAPVTATGTLTARTIADRFADVVNVKDFGAVCDGTTDDTAAVQAAIGSITARGIVMFPQGTCSVSGITLPTGIEVSLVGSGGTVLKARPGTTAVLTIENDITRGGARAIRDIAIDGNSVASVIGIKSGNTTSAALYVRMENLFISGCEVGVDLYSAMEHTLVDVTCISNTVGLKLRQDVTNGGGNANAFIRCGFQSNTIGVICDAVSVYPMQSDAFYSCVFQSNTLCAFAAFDVDYAVQLNACHFENNGTAGTTLVVDGNTIYKCGIQLDASVLSVVDCVLSETTAICIKLLNSATVRLTDSYGYGETTGTFIDGTLSETAEFFGHHEGPGKCLCHVARWPDTFTPGASFTATGEALVTPSASVTNAFTSSSPSVPLLENAAGATINADAADSLMGMVSSVTFLASTGDTGSNRITIAGCGSAGTVTAGDRWVISFMVKASVATKISFVISAGSHATFGSCPISTGWRRVVIAFTAGSSTSSLVYVFPATAEGATVYFAKIQSLQVATGADARSVSEVVSRGLFNNGQNEFFYTAAPSSGTWKRGDIVWNTAPSAGGAPGWVCVSAGPPATWKAMAGLDP